MYQWNIIVSSLEKLQCIFHLKLILWLQMSLLYNFLSSLQKYHPTRMNCKKAFVEWHQVIFALIRVTLIKKVNNLITTKLNRNLQ